MRKRPAIRDEPRALLFSHLFHHRLIAASRVVLSSVQLSGINAVTFFAADIFKLAGLAELVDELSITLQLVKTLPLPCVSSSPSSW